MQSIWSNGEGHLHTYTQTCLRLIIQASMRAIRFPEQEDTVLCQVKSLKEADKRRKPTYACTHLVSNVLYILKGAFLKT